MTARRWVEYTVAVLAGNGIYFLVLHPGLPASLRHEPFRMDAGLLIDFLCCLFVYGIIRLASRHARRRAPGLPPSGPTGRGR